jgi:DNA-binding PadR family transcriptional regulator
MRMLTFVRTQLQHTTQPSTSMITATEALILSLLANKSVGAYGSELLHLSEGKLKRGSVYTLLSRLEDAGFVKGAEEAPTVEFASARTRYRITAAGHRARQDFGRWTGLIPAGGLV